MRGVLAILVIAGVVAAVAFTGTASSNTTVVPVAPAPGATANPAAGGGLNIVAPVRIVLECESPTQVEGKAPAIENGVLLKEKDIPVLVVKEESHGKTVRFVDMPDKWIERCSLEKIKDKAGALPGKLAYEFEAPRDDTYYVYLRAKWFDTCGNSVWVRMNESSYYNLEDENGKTGEKTFQWDWHPLMLEGKPLGIKLAKGKHTLHFAVREDGPQLDQWLVTTEASRPVGNKPAQ